jgi:hypothetical protein
MWGTPAIPAASFVSNHGARIRPGIIVPTSGIYRIVHDTEHTD